jgi:transposase
MTQIDHHDKRSGTTYVYESKSYWDKTKKQPRSHRTLIGKRDPQTGQITPTDGRRKNPKHPQQHPQQPTTTIMNRKFYGATHLLDQITQKLHIEEDLKQCFPQTYKQILSIAYYLTLEDNSPLYRFEKWNHLHQHPHNTNIPSQRSSEIFTSITENQKNQFLKQFANRHAKKECWLYDTTSISSYSQTLKQVQWGKNKENDKLPQINLAIAYGEESNLPFYYRKLAGNIVDVSTVKRLLADFEALGFDKIKLVFDRGFYSKANVDLLLKDKIEFLVALKLPLGFVRSNLDKVYDSVTSFENYNEQYELYSLTVPVEWDTSVGGGQRVFLHLFFDVERAAEDKKRFDRRLAQMRGELLSGRCRQENMRSYEKYFFVEKSFDGGVVEKVVVDEAVVVGEVRRFFGFFALLSSVELSSIVALELYRNRDLVEKAFGDVKDRLNLRRVLVSSEQGLDGKLFVCYLGLVYLSYIKRHMQVAGLFKDYTLQSLIDRLDVIECFEYPNQSLRAGEITEKQKQLYKDLKVNPPT